MLKYQQKKFVILSYLNSVTKTPCHVSQFPIPKELTSKIAHMILVPHDEVSFETQNYQIGQKEN